MKKILLFLIFLILSTKISAQYDTEHWFAPMVDRTQNPNQVQRLYFSTNETTPFKVDIYNNNAIIGSVTISKNAPQYYQIPTRNIIIVSPTDLNPALDLFTPVNKGIYVKGEQPFYASLRFSVSQHAEILTSKGAAGKGKDFRIVMAPIQVNNDILNFMTSIMATEDNTNVTVSGFDSGLKFSDGISRTQFVFTLKKGQSYIIDGLGDKSANKKGLIGAKITSDKPVSITNGNFNGQYAGDYPNASDILMDQGVPEDKLGKTFVLVKGNGANSFLDNTGTKKTTMEKAIIVAVEDNTEIYLNNDTTPAKILQTGEYFETPPDSYKNQGSGHYNLYISTNNKNIYVYQLLAGIENGNPLSNANGEATGGVNYIPPLSCYLPREINEIGLIDENRVFISSIGAYRNKIPTKLNIITERGATIDVKRNGVSMALNASNGPFDVTGNNSWVTYSIPNVTDNIAVFSSKAVTAGISAGDDAVGYGGYFAGFSFIPAILEQTGCLPDVVLKLPEGYDKYQWMYKDNDGNVSVIKNVNGTVPGANVINPLQVGYYWAVVQQGSCAPITVEEKKILLCSGYTPMSYNICDALPPTLVKLTLGNQGIKSIDPLINPTNPTAPSKGKLIIDNVAKTISYIPTVGETGEDSFWYKITGSDPSAPETEEVHVKIYIKNIIANDTIVKGCKINNTEGQFDLSKVNTDVSLTKVFYKFQNDADNDTGLNTILAADLGNYRSQEGFVYLRLNNGSCKKTVKVELKFFPKAELVSATYEGCDLYYKGIAVDFDLVKGQLLKDATYFPDVNFYLSGVKLANGWSYSSDTVVQMEVISPDGCSTEKFNITFKVGARLALLKTTATDPLCDPDLDDSEDIDLNKYKNLFLNTADMTIQPKFYLSLSEAQEDKNALPNGNVTLMGQGDKIYYYRFEKTGVCPNVGTLTIKYAKGFASTTLKPSYTICEDSTQEVNAGTAHKSYVWYKESDPLNYIGKGSKISLAPGKYYVILTSPNDCDYKQNVEIIGSPKAILDISKLNATFCDEDFDDEIKVKFSTQITPVILQNPHPDLKVEYYKDSAYTQLITSDGFTYKVDTRVYVKVRSAYCGDVTGFIDFKIGNKISLINTLQTVEECDDDLDGNFLVKDLATKYRASFTNDTSAAIKFFVKKSDAQNPIATNSIDEINVNNQQLLFVRISNSTDCPALAELTIKIKVPKKSDELEDKTICLGDTAELDAGPGFTSYEWYKEGEPGIIAPNFHSTPGLPVGKYYVILKGVFPNDCPYKQNVEIKAAELPTIEGMEINGSTVKITAKGGKKPYQYAIDGGSYQSSDTFTNVSPGLHKAYVISADDCDPVEKEFSVIEIYNLISPNGDGVNDVLDMSLLRYKTNVKFQVFDREGRKLFDGDTKNNYIWDGKQNGKVLPTSSYWYIMQWQDFDNSPPVKYTGWILLKNRSSD